MIVFNDVHASYGKKEILHGIGFTLEKEKFTAVLGKNGSGKSTLVSCVGGSLKYSGKISLCGDDLALLSPVERAKRISVLPQILPDVSLTVKELVTIGRTPYLDLGKRLTHTDIEETEKAISSVGMEKFFNTPVNRLSGGERQKAYLAMTLAQNTDIMVLDEPTTYMDEHNSAEFTALLKNLKNQYGKTVMMVMHDITKAVELADNILILSDGSSAFYGTAAQCVESGVIETVFSLRKSFYEKDGEMHPMYYL